MSHVVDIQLLVEDLDCLGLACKELGLDLRRGQKTWQWFGEWLDDYKAADAAYLHGIKPEDYGKCEHAIAMPGCEYEIGLVNRPDGKPGYALVYDFYGPGQKIKTALGQKLEKLKHEYALQVVKKQARKEGKSVRAVKRWDNGQTEVILTSRRW